ncbi:molybdopterin synthase catalytic subunit isoform X2 [Struthio camelus]|uniref:molybdopterin synthase catalytic subunit isoform X2 n=1 Tax=Struthio camelus TaxID=8801 RepID=UPI00051E3978|nr:PREDICTED: molybdopterin synthase catalytic subunit {ECO:0000255/HAMAP-Rule:MF_03052} isoform X1 [Struthio camelus australis]
MDESKDVPKDFIKLKSEKLSVDEVSELVISPYCGAVSLFIGTTRNNFEGKKVVHLEYEAYTSMAETEIKKICRDVRQKWPSVKHIAVHHRLGLVPITEASVIIAVSSPHRAESLEATRYCINTLKASVPIWKKELEISLNTNGLFRDSSQKKEVQILIFFKKARRGSGSEFPKI